SLLLFYQRNSLLELLQSPGDLRQWVFVFVMQLRPRNLGIAELPVERGEQEERVLAAVSQGDPPLAVPEQRVELFGGLVVPLPSGPLVVMFAEDVDQVGQVDHPPLSANGQQPFAPHFGVRRVARHGSQSAIVAE